jgi:caa(3)-type oxidase subunit IV
MTRTELKSVVLVPLATWAGLCLALAATAAYAFIPDAPIKPVAALAIAAFKVFLIAAFFMRLDRASALVRLTAVAGFLWLSFLFIFAFADYAMRAIKP